MRRKSLLWIILSASLVVLMSAGSVFAAGFALYEGGARGLVLGAGMTAAADDASAVFYNPAGITQLKGIHTMFGATFINPNYNVVTEGTPTGNQETGLKSYWHTIPHAYYTQQFSDRIWFGLGAFSRFGLETEYPENWAGRYSSYHGHVQSIEINPNVAYKINSALSVAGGLNITYFNFNHYQRKIPTALGDVDASLEADAWGWGFNLAAHYKPVDWFSAGISYRSRVSQHLEGDADFTVPNPAIAGLFPDTDINGNLRLPDMVFAGVNFKALKNLSIGGGVYWTNWSTYDKLQIFYDDGIGPAGTTESKTIKHWEDTFRYMIGVEWNATSWMDVRASYTYDECPIPDRSIDYLLPDSDRHQFAFGLGFHKGPWLCDVTYMYLMITGRDIQARPAEGIYGGEVKDGYAHLIGLSLGYKF